MGESDVMKKEAPPGTDLSKRGAKKERSVHRPRAGLILLILSGLFTLYIPVHLYWLTFVPGNFAFTGILFGGLLLACGIIGWFMPSYVRVLGIFGIPPLHPLPDGGLRRHGDRDAAGNRGRMSLCSLGWGKELGPSWDRRGFFR